MIIFSLVKSPGWTDFRNDRLIKCLFRIQFGFIRLIGLHCLAKLPAGGKEQAFVPLLHRFVLPDEHIGETGVSDRQGFVRLIGGGSTICRDVPCATSPHEPPPLLPSSSPRVAAFSTRRERRRPLACRHPPLPPTPFVVSRRDAIGRFTPPPMPLIPLSPPSFPLPPVTSRPRVAPTLAKGAATRWGLHSSSAHKFLT